MSNPDKKWHEPAALSFSSHGVLWDVIFALALGSLLFAYLVYRVSGRSTQGHEATSPPEKAETTPEDEDVAAERTMVQDICQSRCLGSNTLVAGNLHKVFGDTHAVRGLSFVLRHAECFGLLGVNGAGKTTTFRMLAALIQVTYGDAFMKDAVLSEDTRKWQSKLGYCPQSGALLDKLDAYETLYLFGRLRGVPEASLASVVDDIIDVTDLRQHAAKRCIYYSGGNKRKLSIAVALIGFPEVVLLDEPYAGVDVLARAHILAGLTRIKNRTQCTIMVTSHSMEDCELACDRMCIMVQGKMMCLGTLQHLKDKFGKGYKLQFILPDNSTATPEELTKSVVDRFPEITVVDVQKKLLEFRMEEKLPWSALFQKIAVLEKDFTFEHVLVSDNTLEQIFIQFAREAQAKKKALLN